MINDHFVKLFQGIKNHFCIEAATADAGLYNAVLCHAGIK